MGNPARRNEDKVGACMLLAVYWGKGVVRDDVDMEDVVKQAEEYVDDFYDNPDYEDILDFSEYIELVNPQYITPKI